MQKKKEGTQKRDGVIKHTKHRRTTEEMKGGSMSEQKEKEEEQQKLSERTEVKDYS